MGKKIGSGLVLFDGALILAGIYTVVHGAKERQTNRQLLGLGMMTMGFFSIEHSSAYLKKQLRM